MDLEKLVVKVMAETTDAQTKLKKIRDEVKKTSDASDKNLGSLGKGGSSGLDKTLKKVRAMNDAIKSFGRNAKLNAGLIKPTQGFVDLSEKIIDADSALNEFRAQLDTLDQSSEEFRELSAAISDAEEFINGMNDALNDAVRNGTAFENTKPPSFMRNMGAYMKEGLRSMGSFVRDSFSGLPAPSGLKKITDHMRSIGATSKMAANGVKEFGQGIVNDVKTAVGWLAKLGSGFGKVLSKIPLLGKSARTARGGLDSFLGGLRGIWNIAKMFVIGSGISGWINATKEGFNNLSAYSANTRASLNSLRVSLLTLKNAFATAFAPILNVVAPILATLIDWCTAAATAIAHLMAALTGKSTVVIARKATAGVASGVGSVGSAADDAKGSVDELKKSLMGFDQINKLDDNSSGSGGSGGGGGGGVGGAGSMFDTVEVGADALALADMIKEAWANADFTEIGAMLADKMNAALAAIPWDGIQENARKIAKSMATFLNGFIAEADWNLVGKTFAQALNTVFEFGYTFATTFDWKQFGTAIGNAINGFFQNLNLAKAAAGLSAAIKGVLDTIHTALATVDWQEIGSKIGDFIVNIDWLGVAKRIVQILFDSIVAGLNIFEGIGLKVLEWIEKGLKKIGINVDLTGTLTKLDQSKLSDSEKSVNSTANYTSVKDSLTAGAKTVATVAKYASTSDGRSASEKTLSTTAKYSSVSDARSSAGKSLATTAKINKTTDSRTATYKKLTFTGVISKITSTVSKIKKLLGLATGGIYTGGTWKPITAAASGGSFEYGQMFVAREAGPELVGTIGGHTAVMNNDQIVASVSAGVYRAVLDAMSQKSSGGTLTVVLEGDAGKIFRVVRTEAENYTRSTGQSAFPV